MPKKRPYDQYCPIARALDVVGDRWSMLIVRELFLGPTRYGEFLVALETISTDVLAKRLRELESTDVIERRGDGRYDLTAKGHNLAPVLQALGRWGLPLLAPLDAAPLDAASEPTAARALQMLVISSTGIDLGTERTVQVHAGELICSVTSGADGLTARRGPAAEAEAVVTTDGATLWAVGFGQLSWSDAVASGAIKVDGDHAAAKQLLSRRGPGSAHAADA